MGLFKKTADSFLDQDDEAWIVETFAWLTHRIQPLGALLPRPPVLPTSEFFPVTDCSGHDRAAFIFDCVRRHMDMLDWDCQLVAQPERPPLSIAGIPFHGPMQSSAPAGTFGTDGNTVVITYDPAEIARPKRLIAILAHELAHYRLAAIAEDVPGGPDLAEQATDLTSLAFGFGVFGANAAFDYQQHQDYQSAGWKTQRLGYLSERVWIFGIAVLLIHSGSAPGPLEAHLKPHLRSDLRAALRSLRRRPALLAPLPVS